MMADNI